MRINLAITHLAVLAVNSALLSCGDNNTSHYGKSDSDPNQSVIVNSSDIDHYYFGRKGFSQTNNSNNNNSNLGSSTENTTNGTTEPNGNSSSNDQTIVDATEIETINSFFGSDPFAIMG